MTEYYYLNEQRAPQGPHSLDELARMMEAGQVNPTTLVACKGATSWEPLGTILSQECLPTPPTLPVAPSTPSTPVSPQTLQGTADCPHCRRDLSEHIADQLPVRCPYCNHALRAERPTNVWSNFCYVLRNFTQFKGRATRAEFWSFQLINAGVMLALVVMTSFAMMMSLFSGAQIAMQASGKSELDTAAAIHGGVEAAVFFLCCILLLIGWSLFAFIPNLSVTTRRLHDTGWSAWLLIAYFISLGVLHLLSLYLGLTSASASFFILGALLVLLWLASLGLAIFIFVLTLMDSDRGTNAYGVSPKYPKG